MCTSLLHSRQDIGNRRDDKGLEHLYWLVRKIMDKIASVGNRYKTKLSIILLLNSRNFYEPLLTSLTVIGGKKNFNLLNKYL